MPAPHSHGRALRRLAGTILTASPRHAALASLLMLGLSLTEGVALLMLVPLLQLVGIDAGTGSPAALVAAVSAVFGWARIQPTLVVVLAVYVAMAALQGLLQQWQATVSAAMEHEVASRLRMRVYRAIGGMKWVFFARSRPSEFTHVLTSEVERAGTAAHCLIDAAVTTLVVVVYLAVALKVSASVTALVLASGGVLAWLLRGRMTDARHAGEQLSTSWSELHAAIGEHLGSVKTAKIFGAQDRHTMAFERLERTVQDVYVGTARHHARLRQQALFGSAVMLALIVYVGRGLLALPTAHLLMLLVLFARLMPRMTGLLNRAQALATFLPAVDSVEALESRCRAAAEPVAGTPRQVTLHREIRLHGITFGYSDDAPVLRDLHLIVPARRTTAIVGPSGAGKSTLADLLLGLVTPVAGDVFIDGVRLGPECLQAWRAQVGYVTQDMFLFHDSVRANLLWARPDASDRDLWHALEQAAADRFAAGLPHGLDTVVGERGVLISGGERQRLSLARALLRRPRLLVLDEATNALDTEHEARIQHAIERLRDDVTILVMTHRLSAVRGADLIHVLENGRIAESGSWPELLSYDSRFVELSRSQQIDRSVPRDVALVTSP